MYVLVYCFYFKILTTIANLEIVDKSFIGEKTGLHLNKLIIIK